MAVTNDLGHFTNAVWENAHRMVVNLVHAMSIRSIRETRNTLVDNGLRRLYEFRTAGKATAQGVHILKAD